MLLRSDLWNSVSISPGFWILTGWFALDNNWRILGIIIAAAAVHEMGHCLALRILGVPITGLNISVFGAELAADRGCLSYPGELAVVLAGPGMNLLCAAVLTALGGTHWESGAVRLRPASGTSSGWRAGAGPAGFLGSWPGGGRAGRPMVQHACGTDAVRSAGLGDDPDGRKSLAAAGGVRTADGGGEGVGNARTQPIPSGFVKKCLLFVAAYDILCWLQRAVLCRAQARCANVP